MARSLTFTIMVHPKKEHVSEMKIRVSDGYTEADVFRTTYSTGDRDKGFEWGVEEFAETLGDLMRARYNEV